MQRSPRFPRQPRHRDGNKKSPYPLQRGIQAVLPLTCLPLVLYSENNIIWQSLSRWNRFRRIFHHAHDFSALENANTVNGGRSREQNVRNGLYFDIRVSAKGNVIGNAQTVSEADLQKKAEQRIRQEISDTFIRGIEKKADVYNLMEVAYRKVPREWKRIASANGFPLRADSIRSIRVDVRITNAGKNNKPLPETGSKP
mgnify:CR=1 FL=1